MTEQHNNYFVISVAGSNIDTSIINIEEMALYCESRKRFANVVTEKQIYDELDKLNYSLIGNYKTPKPRIINSKTKPYIQVYHSLSENYKTGLLIAENDTLSDDISDLLCESKKWEENDIDIMICRHGFGSVTKKELQRANYIRISADPDFNPMDIQSNEVVLKEKTLTLLICQLFVNNNFNSVNRYLDIKSDEFTKDGIVDDYIDYHELNKQLSYFIYYDITADKIVNVDRKTIVSFVETLVSQGILPVPLDQIRQVAEIITL